MDITFDEEYAYNKSKKKPAKYPEEPEAHRIQDTTMNDATQEDDWEIEEPYEPIGPPQEKNTHKRKPASIWEAIKGAEIYGSLEEMHRERKRTRFYSGYVSLLHDIIDKEPSNYEEAVEKK